MSPDDAKHRLPAGKANWRAFSESTLKGVLRGLKPELGLLAGLLLFSAWAVKFHWQQAIALISHEALNTSGERA